MASQYTPPPDDSYESTEPQPHPYLHEPLLYISSLPQFVTDENLAIAFSTCAPFRPRITRDGTADPLSGMIEFKVQDKGVPQLSSPLL
jgi:polyadenylate-binding protein